MNAAVHQITCAVSIPALAVAGARLTTQHRRTGHDASITVEVHSATFTATTIPEPSCFRLRADTLSERGVAPAAVVAPCAIHSTTTELFVRFGEVNCDVWIPEHVPYVQALERQDWPATLAKAEVAMTT